MELKPFCETFVRIGSTRMSFQGRGYLDEIYGAANGNLVLRCARQVEKSTLLSNLVTFNAVRYPGTRILYVCPRIDQAEVFSRSRLWPAITSSPLIRRALIGDKKMSPTSADLYFSNGSELFIRSAFHSADGARGISADMLLLDEYQDLAPGSLPVLMEIMSHSDRKQVVITGTPKHVDNPLESALSRSTNCEWLVAVERKSGSTKKSSHRRDISARLAESQLTRNRAGGLGEIQNPSGLKDVASIN